MIYNSNKDIRQAIKIYCNKNNMTLSQLAIKAGITPQQLNNIFNKRNISFNDLKRILSAIDCKLVFDIMPNNETPGINESL